MWTKAAYLNIIILVLCFRQSHSIACKREKNKDVDWYVNYKIPKIYTEPTETDLAEGVAYAYIIAPGSSWKLSSKNVLADSGSMLENTMKDFYDKKKNLTYLFYNDDPPDNFEGSAVGHLKGVVAFDGTSGFWLLHSIPNFGDPSAKYEYPESAMMNGQSILCVTFKTAELNEISHQLLYSHPNIYGYQLTEEVEKILDDKARTLFSDKPSFIRKEPLTRAASLQSLASKYFISFAKDNQLKVDLYSDIIAPSLKSSLVSETWRRGSGNPLPPSCKSDYEVVDVTDIKMSITSRKETKVIEFKSTQDHSKWAIAEQGENWVCIGDLNRMKSQGSRGGGALCFVSAAVWKAFDSIIASTDECKT